MKPTIKDDISFGEYIAVRRSRANKKYIPTSIFSGHKDHYHRRQSEDQAVDKIHMPLL